MTSAKNIPSPIKSPLEIEETSRLRLFQAPGVIQYFSALVMTAMATAIAAGFDRHEVIPNLSLIYVIPVVVSSVLFGLGPALFSAVLGALAFNFFFTAPRLSLAVDDPANIWAIVLLFVVGCVTSAVVSTARRKADELAEVREQKTILHDYSRAIVKTADIREALPVTARALNRLFHAPSAILLLSEDGTNEIVAEGGISPTAIEVEAARSALTHDEAVTGGVYPFDQSRFDFWPVSSAKSGAVVIGVAFPSDRRPLRPTTEAEVVATLLALTLDRQGGGRVS